jgi:purine-nucleoside phosphorylase
MADWKSKLAETLGYIREHSGLLPSVGVILGSGLGSCLPNVNEEASFHFSELPHFPRPRHGGVEGHQGKLVLGRALGRNLAVMRGRVHYYEGHPIQDVAYPVRVLHGLGVEALIVTNACGAVNSGFSPGDIMVIRDHINLMGVNPLVGEAVPDGAERFPDMTQCYDEDYMDLVQRAAEGLEMELREGVLAAFSGPNYETPAEIGMARTAGADAVTMSTVPEVMVARQLGMRVLGLSCVTNMAAGVSGRPLEHGDVLRVAGEAADKLDTLLSLVIPHLP